MEAKLKKSIENTKPALSIAHIASSRVCVEDAEIVGDYVEVSYFKEDWPEFMEFKEVKIPVSEITAFIAETYGNWINTGYSEDRSQLYMGTDAEYLHENPNTIVEEYLNSGKGASHV